MFQEKDEVMKNLSSANRKNEVERERQAELIAQRREKRMQQKKTTEEKALELLEKAVAMDKMYVKYIHTLCSFSLCIVSVLKKPSAILTYFATAHLCFLKLWKVSNKDQRKCLMKLKCWYVRQYVRP